MIDLYSNVNNSLGKPIPTPQLKIVTLHPYYSLLHSYSLKLHLHYTPIGLTVHNVCSLIGYWLYEIENSVLFTASFPAPRNSAWHFI